MDAAISLNSPTESTDIFSLSDQVLSDSLQFIEEIGFGNWGSVWLCRPKRGSSSATSFVPEQKIAVKLVHRSKTSTTAARVRSLWNEMKIVRSFKSDPHPSIIPFHSFIITPSYALITMTYLPVLVPVEVDESKAKEWFRFLLSGVEFLHKRGVVHNDIKPANILLSPKSIPVLVDFGFAEKYDLDSDTAFHSNLSYGTPEYLSPERARGLPHDTRKSDVWSLGVTFFEILTGRTPFEQTEGEQFTSKEDLEKYWARTLRGKWIGTWKMSQGMEKLLQRMIAPNADLRCTTSQAMVDSYWRGEKETASSHKRSSSCSSSVVFERDIAKLLDTPSSRKEKESLFTPPGLDRSDMVFSDCSQSSLPRHVLTKSKSQPRVAATKPPPRKRMPPITDLSPVKASPPSSPLSVHAKENIASFNALASSVNSRKPLGARKPFGVVSVNNSNLPRPHLAAKPSANEVNKSKRKVGVLSDLQNSENSKENSPGDWPRTKDSTSVRDRMREWEKERQRLREAERLDEIVRDRDENPAKSSEEELRPPKPVEKDVKGIPQPRFQERDIDISIVSTPPVLPLPALTTPLTQVLNDFSAETPVRPSKESHRNIFKHSIKKSIDKTMQFYKSSTFGQVTARSARSLSIDIKNEAFALQSPDQRQSFEDASLHNITSPLPTSRKSAQMERVAAAAESDRLAVWMRNVEKVVEDARQNFAASSVQDHEPLPSLPVPPSRPLSRNASQNNPQPRSNRSSRLPRKILAASQIFTEDNVKAIGDQSMMSNDTSACATVNTTNTRTIGSVSSAPFEGNSQFVIPEIHTPSRQRRATVSTGSPEASMLYNGSPSKRKDKTRSHGNLFDQRIARLSLIEAELNKVPAPEPSPSSPRLSEVINRNLVIATPFMSRELLLDDVADVTVEQRQQSLDDLTSSPCHVEPYQPRKLDTNALPDTPGQRRLEGVYDRFLMATSGVKRVGKGYQSDNIGPVGNGNTLGVNSIHKRESHRAFYTARKPMPPPVSSTDLPRAASADSLGYVNHSNFGLTNTSIPKEESNNTVALVRRAIKAIVPGKATVSRRLSRMA